MRVIMYRADRDGEDEEAWLHLLPGTHVYLRPAVSAQDRQRRTWYVYVLVVF